MCDNCMHLVFDDGLKDYICAVEPLMDEDDFARMSYAPSRQCPYFKLGDEYTLVHKQN